MPDRLTSLITEPHESSAAQPFAPIRVIRGQTGLALGKDPQFGDATQ
jgi:hypothetical protein